MIWVGFLAYLAAKALTLSRGLPLMPIGAVKRFSQENAKTSMVRI
jgi:hypothetical protein